MFNDLIKERLLGAMAVMARWVTVPSDVELPDNQQDRDMIARELLIKFQMSPRHPMVDLRKAYKKF